MRPPPAGPSGFDTSRVSPQDAVVTLRSLRRRYAEAFDQAEKPDARGGPAGAAGSAAAAAGGLSPLDHAAWTVSAVEAIGTALRHVLTSDNPPVDLPPVDPAGPVPGPGAVAAVLARLGEAAGVVADEMADVHGDDWARTGQTATGSVTALDIARLAVRIGVEHLRAAESALKSRADR